MSENGNSKVKEYIDLISRLIKEIGFPIVVASVLLYFLMTQMPAFKDSMVNLTTAISSMTEAVERLTGQQDELSNLIRDERKYKRNLVEELREGRNGHGE